MITAQTPRPAATPLAPSAAAFPLGLRDVARELDTGAAWLRDYLAGARKSCGILGLSGGIDSAVTALWAARAIGARNLVLCALPYGLVAPAAMPPSTPDSLEDARRVAALLPEANFRVIDIAPAVDAMAETMGLLARLHACPGDPVARLAFGNLKARMRAVYLRTEANVVDALLLGTENLTEHLFGYATLGGDEESDLELLLEYFKTEVRDLAAALGAPASILAKAPSADLWAGQTDEGELGVSYAVADRALAAAVRLGIGFVDPAAVAAAAGVPLSDADVTLARVAASAFKRQAKPVFRRPA